jgi:Kef-type K+ transport system membrane component KefB
MTLLLLVALGYLAARYAVDWLARHALVVSGAEYLVLGLLLGPKGTGLLDETMLDRLTPFFNLAIGWLGAGVGMRFWLPLLARTPGVLFRVGFAQSLATLGLVAGATWTVLHFAVGLAPTEAALPAVVLGAIAAASAHQAVEVAARRFGHRNLVVRQLEVATGTDALVAMVAFTVVLAIFHRPIVGTVRAPTPTEWVAITVGIGLVGGWLFHLFLGEERSPDRLFIAIAGAIILTTGAANYVGMSPLLPGLLLGVILVNTSRQRDAIRETITRVERPLYFIMLVCAGALWAPSAADGFLLVLVYLCVRALARLGGARLVSRANGLLPAFGPRWGVALLGQGGLAVALGLDYLTTLNAVLPNLVFTTAFISVILTDLFAAKLAFDVIGELPHTVELPVPTITPSGGH